MPYFSYTQIYLGSLTLQTWGLFLGMAFLAGYFLVQKQARKRGISQSLIFWLVIFIFFGALFGARLGYVLQLEIFNWSANGLMFYGGLFGGLIIGWIYLKIARQENFLKLADIFAPGIAFGIFWGRVGCFLVNDHQGALSNLPWAIHWPDGTLRHPVALYLALNALIMFLLLWNWRDKLKNPGQLFFVFLIWYGASRFLLDFSRASNTSLADPHYWGLTISQYISLFVFLFSVVLFKRR